MTADKHPTRKTFWTIFFAALAIRWIYATTLYAAIGLNGLTGADSLKYLNIASAFASAIKAGAVHGWQWLGPDTVMMPLFTWVITINALLFGSLLPLAYVLTQGVFDAGTCVLVYLLAHTINPRYAPPAAVAAIVNPTQIVLSGLIYPDTPFVFFVALLFVATVRWLHAPGWRWTIFAAVALGAAALIRILIFPWTAALTVFLLLALLIGRRLSIQRLAQLGAMAAIASLFVAPLLARNVTQYGAWALTSQSGFHLAGWVVPLAKEARDRTPWLTSFEDMEARKLARFGPPVQNPFEESRRYGAIGGEDFSKLKLTDVLKAWTTGAAINLASPAVILIPPIINLPRTGFYATAGSSFFEKIGNFLFRSESALYTWVLLIGIAGLGVVRLIQITGTVKVIRASGHAPVLLLFGAWLCFILAVNGPIASPKYRLPLEPILAVLTGAGICSLRRLSRPSE